MNDLEMTLRAISLLFEQMKRAKEGRAASAPLKPAFTIAISREAGALGTTVAKEIGRQLHWPVYDREILDKVAEEMRRPTFHFEGMDERPVNWIENCVRSFASEHHVNSSVYLKYLVAAVRGLGLRGHCVIVGRGAGYILPRATTVRVHLVAALPDRIKVIMRQHGLIERDAARWVAKTDDDRAEFVRVNLRADPTAGDQYDLVLNTSRLPPAECARIIVGALRFFESAAGHDPSTAKADTVHPPVEPVTSGYSN
jgi:cytidylate kinase